MRTKLLILLLSLGSLCPILDLSAGWLQLSSPTNRHIMSVYFVSSSTGWVVGYGGNIYKTTNGGVNWTSQNFDTNNTYQSVFFAGSSIGYAVGYNIFFQQGIIVKTTNGGGNWNYQYTGPVSVLNSVFFLDANSGHIAGYDGVLNTTNGGNSWQIRILSYALRAIFFTDSYSGFAVGQFSGDQAGILRTTDSGINWTSQYTGTMYSYLYGGFSVNGSTSYAVGGWGPNGGGNALILRTTNSGINWNVILQGGGIGNLNSCYFTNTSTGYAAGGTYGQIIKTTNGGNNWYIQTTNVTDALNEIFFGDANTGYAVGNNGVILKTTDGGGPIGIKPISNEVPKEFRLEQNYPNPFNSSTKFKILISKLVEVKVSVFDVLGREVAILVNEKLQPGTYEVDWDAANYPSGVYIYCITAGDDYHKTKRMVLSK